MSFKENIRLATSENSILTPVSNPTTVGINVTVVTEPRGIPLLYVQSPGCIKPSNVTKTTGIRSPPPLVPTSTKFPAVNGVSGGKIVQVQSPNSTNPTIAYVGTLFRPGVKGQEPVAQKILLTPVKGKDGAITRFILPRPVVASSNSSQSSINVLLPPGSGKPLSYVLQPVTQNSSVSTTKTSSSQDSPMSSIHKMFTPNIIRQKVSDSKLSSLVQVMPKGITVMSPSSSTTAITTESPSVKKNVEVTSVPVTSESTITTTVASTTSTVTTTTSAILSLPTDSTKVTPTSTITVNSNLQANLPIVTTSSLKSSAVEQIKSHEVVTLDDDEKDVPKENSVNSSLKERVRKRKGLLSNDSIKKITQPSQIELNKVLPGAEEFDPIQIIEWDPCGIGKLPGSDIKFVVNDLGMLEIHEENQTDKRRQDILEDLTKRFDRDPDEIFCCVACSCYGLISEFFDDKFCSKSCRETTLGKQVSGRKRDNLGSETDKKRRKTLQNSDSDYQKVSNCIDSSNVKEKDVCENEKDPLALDDETNDEAKDKKNCKKISQVIIEVEDDTPPQPPNFTEKILKENTKSDAEYNQKLIKVKKIIKRGIKIGRTPLPTRTYSKFDEKSKLNLRSRHVEKSDNKNESDNDDAVQESGTVSPKQEIKKKTSSTENTPEKPSPVQFEKFPWSSYLMKTQSRPAWIKLFQNPYPTIPNTFKVGYKLEAIDPEHQAYICAVTVVQIKGYRLKLHFDGYSKMYDFWVNADSENIFPCGFCHQNGISLQPPWGYNPDTFSWASYTTSWKAKAAPAACFPYYRLTATSPNLFRVGMKLEAIDRKNSFLICVASVAAVLGNRILVHFDSWGDVYDYWADTCSPYIHYVGWCKQTKHVLTPPNGIKPSEFSWDKYLKDTNSIAAPVRAFRLRPQIDFKKGTKLEVVDKRAPHLLRVATIKDVLPYQIKIIFDGFPDHFGYWMDDDSPDLHPVGWGDKTLHPVEPPPKDDSNSPCPTPGCIGQGHARGTKFETHSFEKDCPYSLKNLTDDELLPDRLSGKPCDLDSSQSDMRSDEVIDVDKSDSDESDEDMNIKRWRWLGIREENKRMLESKLSAKDKMEIKLRRSKRASASLEKNSSAQNKFILPNMPAKILHDDIVLQLKDMDPLTWDSNRVADFTKTVLDKSNEFIVEEDIDGEAFLMLTQEDLVDQLGFKLGEAIKLFNAIKLLRQKVT